MIEMEPASARSSHARLNPICDGLHVQIIIMSLERNTLVGHHLDSPLSDGVCAFSKRHVDTFKSKRKKNCDWTGSITDIQCWNAERCDGELLAARPLSLVPRSLSRCEEKWRSSGTQVLVLLKRAALLLRLPNLVRACQPLLLARKDLPIALYTILLPFIPNSEYGGLAQWSCVFTVQPEQTPAATVFKRSQIHSPSLLPYLEVRVGTECKQIGRYPKGPPRSSITAVRTNSDSWAYNFFLPLVHWCAHGVTRYTQKLVMKDGRK